MPSLTIEMDDAALTELGAQAERAKLDPEQLAARMLARQIYRLTGPARSRLPHKSQGNPDRAAEAPTGT
jgi:hypothetical protein